MPATTLVCIILLFFGAEVGNVAAGPTSARLIAMSGKNGVMKYNKVFFRGCLHDV